MELENTENQRKIEESKLEIADKNCEIIAAKMDDVQNDLADLFVCRKVISFAFFILFW